MQQQKPSYDPAALRDLRRFVLAPKRTSPTAVAVPARLFESPEPCQRLSADYAWIIPCLLYSVIGLDRSIFALFGEARGSDVKVVTALSPTPLFFHGTSTSSSDQRTGLIQGIPHDAYAEFCAYVQSFEFTGGGKAWAVEAKPLRLADPFLVGERRGADATILLPHLKSHNRKVVVLEPAGLMLRTPVLGVVNAS